MTRPLRLAAILTLAALAPVAAPAWAQGMQRGLPAAISPAGRGWQSVGRLDVAGQESAGFCTVSLIAEDRALTAAHCVLDGATGRLHPLGGMQVRLGLQNGRAEASRAVRGVEVANGARARLASAEGAASLVPVDLAILQLDSPVRLPQMPPLQTAPAVLAPGARLTVVSYARGRSEVAGLQEDCTLLARRADGSLILRCEVESGASGSPVISLAGGVPQVVAVVSAMAEADQPGGPRLRVALAAPLAGEAAQRLLQMPAGAQRPPAGSVAGVRIRRPEAGVTGRQGARFLRP